MNAALTALWWAWAMWCCRGAGSVQEGAFLLTPRRPHGAVLNLTNLLGCCLGKAEADPRERRSPNFDEQSSNAGDSVADTSQGAGGSKAEVIHGGNHDLTHAQNFFPFLNEIKMAAISKWDCAYRHLGGGSLHSFEDGMWKPRPTLNSRIHNSEDDPRG